jgi:hypothetical protein
MEPDLPSVADNTNINDARQPGDFKSITFSNYKQTAVRSKLIENMINGRIEPACHWCCELICAGHFMDLWEIILHFVGKHIHIGNPKITIYLEKRFELFRNIMEQGNFTQELQLRNHPTIRELFAEIICTLTTSNRKNSFETIKINREEEFDMTQMTERLKAPTIQYAVPIMKEDDPKELFIAINEFAYHLSPDSRNVFTACYWIEWIIEFDLLCKKRKQATKCQTRTYVPVENKYKNDIIWLIWDAIFDKSNTINSPYITQLLASLRNIFCIKYSQATAKKRRYLIYFAVTLVIDQVPTDIPLMPNKPVITTAVSQINHIYKQIKKNEQKPSTDYLFKNLENEVAMERSLRKMELVNSIDITNK